MKFVQLAVAAILAGTLTGCAQVENVTSGSITEDAASGIPPYRAFLIQTREGNGCLIGQTLQADLTKQFASAQGGEAVLQPSVPTEDASQEPTVYLVFDAIEAPGYLIARVALEAAPDRPRRYTLRKARLLQAEGSGTLILEGEGTGTLRVELLYAATPELAEGWFSCPETGTYDPFQLRFFPAYAPSGMDAATVRQPVDESKRHVVPISRAVVAALPRLAAATEILHAVLHEVGMEENRYILDGRKLSPEALRKIVGNQAAQNAMVLIKPDRGEEFAVLAGEPNFDPTLRQKVAIRRADGSLLGAEVWVTAD
jgi:hypothetical protein